MSCVTRLCAPRFVAAVAAAGVICAVALSARCDGDEPATLPGNWPTVRHDVRRSGYSPQPLDTSSLGLAWHWKSAHAPRPAWYGPAKQDAFANIPSLPSMRSYDLAFHVTAVGDRVFFGSSADDTVYCLDAQSGSEKWSYVTDGPIRVAPTYAHGFVFFGSDDGYAYCLDSRDGNLVWKYSPAPEAPKILNDGRLISPWPCRTGVLVDQGIAYFANSLLPWKHSYLCAIDARTGKPADGNGYQRRLDGMTMEGPMAASVELLISPQGRVPPQIFRRSNGENLGSVKGVGGGSVIVVAPDSTIFHGPAGGNKSRTGGIDASSASKMEKLASYPHGKDIVIAGRRAFMLGKKTLTANDWVDRKMQWSSSCEENLSLIVAGDSVLVGGEDVVAAYSADDGRKTWSHAVDGKAHGLAVAQGRLLVSTDTGAVYAFYPGQAPSKPADRTASATDRSATKIANTDPVPDIEDKQLVGRWLFQQDHVQGTAVRDLAGNNDAVIQGAVEITRVGRHQALVMDGISQSVLIREDHNQASLPRQSISAEAWVRVDQPQTWGGIIGAVRDDGSLERGWLLGFRDRKFCFAINAAEGPDALTYMTADADFQLKTWYHVLGTYNGREQRVYVNGVLAASDTNQRGDIKYPEKTFYEIGAYHDSNEYNRLHGMIHEVSVYDRALSESEALARYESRKSKLPVPKKSPAPQTPLRLATGPWLQFEEHGQAIVRWQTSQPSPSVLRYWLKGARHKTLVTDDRSKTEHQVSLDELKRNRVYHYVIEQPIDGKVRTTQEYTCDTLFDYSVAPPASVPNPFDPNNGPLDYRQVARQVLSETGVTRGLCVILGSGDGHLAYEFARQSRLRIIAVDTDRDSVETARASLRRAKLYGGRVAVHHVRNYDNPNVPGESANLVLSQRLMSSGHLPGQARNVLRLLKPGHGVAYLGQPSDVESGLSKSQLASWFQDAGVQPRWVSDDAGVWAAVQREPLPGAGQWTHLYGRADNSAFGGEKLAGVRKADQLAVQWIGRPGPRYQADRNGRKPSPLAVNGRLFLQGENRIIGMDTMNGTILWSLEVPNFHRFNMPRDCSNWCADEENLYAVMRDKCWRVSAKTGNVEQFYDVVSPENRPFDWGYVSAQDNLLLGSAVPEGTSWTGFNGGEGWYDAKSGPQTAKICSDNLFAVDTQKGHVQWKYSDGLVINPTITIGNGRVYFVQSRDPKLKALPSRRVESPLLWKNLVLTALDVKTGEPIWEQQIQPEPGIVTFYLTHSDQKLVLSSSTDNKYYTYVFDDDTGKARWHTILPWQKDNHGGHMSRPAIVDGKVYVRPHVMSLADGQVLPEKIPGGGCGTYACTSEALFFRAGTVTVWDRNQHSSSTWNRLRPDCWLSTIPADGLLLSPEGGGGCSCGVWMETSVAFKPVASLLGTAPPGTRNPGAP